LAFAALGVAAGMVAIGYFVSEYNVVTVLLYVAAMFLAVFSLIGVRVDVFVVRSRGRGHPGLVPGPERRGGRVRRQSEAARRRPAGAVTSGAA
jgi:hypothetical protein